MKTFYKGQIVYVYSGFNIFSIGYYKSYKPEDKYPHTIVFNKEDLLKEPLEGQYVHTISAKNDKCIYPDLQPDMTTESETSFIKGFKSYTKRKLLIEI